MLCGAHKFQGASEKAEALNIPLPTVVPGQERKRKVPVRFQHSTTASQVSYEIDSVESYYRKNVYYTFIDTLTAELNRRFHGMSLEVQLAQSYSPSTL